MSFKKLRPLLIMLAVLVIIAVIKKRQPAVTTLPREAGLTFFFPQALSGYDIRGIDLYRGADVGSALELRRQGTSWHAASYFDAPVQGAKIDQLLRVLTRLHGELRSDQAQFLKSYQLESGQAYHLLLYTAVFDRPVLHLLIGKRQRSTGFIRVEDDARVYSVAAGFYDALGLHADNFDRPPVIKTWLDLQIHDIPDQQVTSFELRMPDGSWKFSRNMQPQTHVTEPWVLDAPPVTLSLKQGYIDGLVTTLRTLRAEDIVGSDQVEAMGLLHAAHEVWMTWRTGAGVEKMSRLSIGHEHPEHPEKRYARRDVGGPVYLLPDWSFRHLFPEPKTFLQLPALPFKPEEVRSLELSLPTTTVAFEIQRTNAPQADTSYPPYTWKVTSPQVDLALRDDGLQQWLQHLAGFTPDGIAPDAMQTLDALQSGGTRLAVLLENERRHTLQLGNPFDHTAQQYTMLIDDHPVSFLIGQRTRLAIFPPLKELFYFRVLSHPVQEIKDVTWQYEARAWRLIQRISQPITGSPARGAQWAFDGVQKIELDQQLVQVLLRLLSSLTAEDWMDTENPSMSNDPSSLVFIIGLGEERSVRLTIEKQGEVILAKHDDKVGTFVLSQGTYESLRQALIPLSPQQASVRIPKPIAPDADGAGQSLP